MVRLEPCSLYRGHGTAVVESHHICPQSWYRAAGKPVVTPMAELCGLCHNNTHAAIDGLIRNLDVSALPPRCVALARQAMALAAGAGLTPKATL